MALGRIFKERPSIGIGKALYAKAVQQARTPALYADMGAPDTVVGRFELYTLHTVLLVLRLKGRNAASVEIVQALFDAYLEGLDIALREMGVGDLSVGKKMKKYGRAFYGRVGSWEAALAALPAMNEMEALIGRTVYEGVEGADPAPLAAYAARAAATLDAQSDEALLSGDVHWQGTLA